jgi:hypothetical protein
LADTEFHEERDGAMKSGFWLSAIGLILAGCGKLITIEPDPDNRFYTLPVGTLVKVNEELTVPAGWARVFLQRGETVSYGDVDRYHPSCDFELHTVDETPQSIKPGSFTVIDVRPRTEEVVRYRPVQYASRWLLAYGGGGSGGQYMIMHTVRMTLESEEQPGMYMLTCRGALDDPPSALEVSINEMRVALGDKASIVLPEEQ